ncbi:MAG: hypothetical protein E6G33_08100 [Actinobacteria bacterium]|nr:MAG: hypothetical protein E6G33_08100 [Actinomycetota bacterium]
MRVFVTAIVAITTAAVVAGAAADRALAASLCVGSHGGCYQTIQSAVDAAHDGDKITIRPGMYAGGITIDKSVSLEGAGASSTMISGGGPVITIGVAGAPSEPAVGITGVTVTGGVNTGTQALGGGVYVPASSAGSGATVTITDSVVTGNHAAPASAAIGCGGLPFALASGGGIDNAGTMTLNNVLVTNNQAGSDVASDADGGGITNERQATLVLRNSLVNLNIARVTTPNGRFGAGGGLFTRKGSTVTIDGSVVNGNTVDYSTSFPADNPCAGFAQAGGIKIGGDTTTAVSIRDSTISHNDVVATSSGGDLTAFAGGIDDDGVLVLRDSAVSNNRVAATSVGSVFVDSGGLEIEGTATISNSRFAGNSVSAVAPAGTAVSQGGGILTVTPELVTVSDSVISNNVASSTTTTGTASVQGAGILNSGLLELRGVHISDNQGTAIGPAGFAQGGGIWNGTLFPDGPPIHLTLRNSNVSRNTLSATAGLVIHGGGVYTTFPVTLTNSLITKNTPDNCFGC